MADIQQIYFTTLTAVGEAKDAKAKALGTPIKFTAMAVGDGGGALPVPDRTRTTLVREVRRAAINTLKADPQNPAQLIAEQVIPEDEGGWWIRELGLYDEAGDLFAIANCPETYKPVLAQGSGRTQVVRMVLIMSSAASVTLKVDPSIVLATRSYVDGQDAQHATAQDPHSQYLTKEAAALLAPKASPAFTGRVGVNTDAPAARVHTIASAGEIAALFQAAYPALGRALLASFSRAGGAVEAAVRYNDAATSIEFGTVSGHPLVLTTVGEERARIDQNGYVLIGASGAIGFGDAHRISRARAQGSNILAIDGGTEISAYFRAVSSAGFNTSPSALATGVNSSNGRSINAGGTINASGADYAEYMTKSDDCGELVKGAIVGIDAEGKLTDKWEAAVSFLVKSTDPSYVGGDKWGTTDAVGQRPAEPVFTPPAYIGAPHPGEAPGSPEEGLEGEALALYESAQARYAELLAEHEADQHTHAVAVVAARLLFDNTVMPNYLAELAAFEQRLEEARQKVDRIAFCGQVPVNVMGAVPGQYVVPAQDGEGIGAILVDDAAVTFAQYRCAVGVVQDILPDGRANVRVKPV